MKRSKRILALTLSAAMALSLFGCGADKPTPSETATPSADPSQSSESTGAYTPGTYFATGTGLGGTIEFEVTFDADGFTGVEVLSHYESPNIGGVAFPQYIDALLDKQDVTQVEAVSGATVTYNGFVEAMTSAIRQATGEEEIRQRPGTGELNTQDIELSTQVLVIGAGYAGLIAAVSAAENGADVVVLEKRNTYGICGHSITACNTTWQEKAGYTDSVDALTQFWMGCGTALNTNTVNEAMVRLAAEQSAANIEWLAAQGAEFVGCTMAPTNPFQDPFRTHVTTAARNGQKAYIEPLYTKATELGVKFLFDSRATELLQNDDGAIVGAKASNEARTITVNAGAVILSTGGFLNSQELMSKYCPTIIFSENNSGYATGDGQMMAEAVGANMTYNGGSLSYFSNADGVDSDNVGAGMYVTKEGVRFINENHYFMHRSAYAQSLGINTYYGIFDSEQLDAAALEKAIANGSVVQADTLEELAAKLNMDADTFTNTVKTYNGYCDTGVDEQFGKPAERTGYVFDPNRANDYDVDSVSRTYQLLNKIDAAPYYAVTYTVSTNSTSGTVGGCEIDINAQVLDTEGAVIPGLYANGEVANAQVLGMVYPQSGASLSFYMNYGRIAGRNAAAYAMSK